jgi:hypothetical protein
MGACRCDDEDMSVADVVARMRTIEASLPRSDGVACFVALYREVTEGVAGSLERGGFADRRALERLDVVFADLFFAAFDLNERDPRTAPPAWRPLFAARSTRGIAPIQFALAGMNAHINRDLPVALATTWAELEVKPRRGTPQHADYVRVNALLADVEAKLKGRYVTGWLRRLSRIVHRYRRLGDVIAMWNVERARDAAWTNAETLWVLRGTPEPAAEFLGSLDRMVGFASRGLLVPADTTLNRVDRWLRRLRRDPLWWG